MAGAADLHNGLAEAVCNLIDPLSTFNKKGVIIVKVNETPQHIFENA